VGGDTLNEAAGSPNTSHGSQTMGAKVHSREGNSPDHRLRSLNLHQMLRGAAPYEALRGRLGSCHPRAACGPPVLWLAGGRHQETPGAGWAGLRAPGGAGARVRKGAAANRPKIPSQRPPHPESNQRRVDGGVKPIAPGHVRRVIGTIRRGAWGVASEEGVIAQRQPGAASPKCE